MRRIWVRTGAVSTDIGAWHTSHVARIAEAEAAFAKTPDRRAATQSLLALYAQHGLLDKAQTLAEQWASRDPLDPDALVARADLAARAGDRTEALRRLGSVVDVRPETASAQTRLSELYERLGDPVRACAHRVAQAELSPDDAAALSKAVRCSREVGATELATRLLADASAATRTAAERALAAPVLAEALAGDVRLEATWGSDDDVDLALIGPRGVRLSWTGGAHVRTQNVAGGRHETLSFVNLPAGRYLVEVTRVATGQAGQAVTGTVVIGAVGVRKTVPFVLSEGRTELAKLEISYVPQLVPVE